MGSILQSTKNTRYLSGGHIPKRRYLRSDVPSSLTEAEINWLREEGFLTVIDLRTREEMEKNPCPLAMQKDFSYLHLPVTGGYLVPESAEQVIFSYLHMVNAQINLILKTIEEAASPVLYFCNAGKDRTGVVSALLLLSYGASKEEIIDDYIKSRDNLKEMLIEYVKQNEHLDLATITPRESTMEKFLAQVKMENGQFYSLCCC